MKKKTPLRRLLGAALALFCLALFFHWQQNGIVTETYVIESPGLPAAFDGLRIVHLSDNHGKQFGEDNKALLKAVAQLKPDLIALTGDLIDQAEQLSTVPVLARGLAAIAPTYYVTGNHEWAVRRINDLKALLTENGVSVLSGEAALWEKEGAVLAVAGVDDPNGPVDQTTGPDLLETLPADYTILLSHRDTVEEYAGWGYDLVLCGHGHGGILRLPVLDRGLLGTDRSFFPEYDGGVYAFPDGGHCVVSRGLGSNTVPIPAFRLFNRPDLPLIVLKHQAGT